MPIALRIRRCLVIMGGLLAALACGGCTTAPAVPRCDQPGVSCLGELLQAQADWTEAYNRRDARQLQPFYAPGALITDDEYLAVPLSGAALPAFFEQLAQRPTARVRWLIGNLQIFGETAVRSGECEFTEQVDGQALTRPARYSFAYQRIDGRWLIVLQHSTRLR